MVCHKYHIIKKSENKKDKNGIFRKNCLTYNKKRLYKINMTYIKYKSCETRKKLTTYFLKAYALKKILLRLFKLRNKSTTIYFWFRKLF